MGALLLQADHLKDKSTNIDVLSMILDIDVRQSLIGGVN